MTKLENYFGLKLLVAVPWLEKYLFHSLLFNIFVIWMF